MQTNIEKDLHDLVLPNPTIKRLFRKSLLFAIVLVLIIAAIISFFFGAQNKSTTSIQTVPTPQPQKNQPFGIYSLPTIPKKETYIIFMVGDSMTEELGEFGGQLNEFLNTLYHSTPGHQHIVIDNYATGSTKLLGLQESMTKKKINKDAVLD